MAIENLIWYNILITKMEVRSMEKNKLNILNKFFSRNTFRHCYEDGYDKVYGQVIRRYVDNGVGKLI